MQGMKAKQESDLREEDDQVLRETFMRMPTGNAKDLKIITQSFKDVPLTSYAIPTESTEHRDTFYE